MKKIIFLLFFILLTSYSHQLFAVKNTPLITAFQEKITKLQEEIITSNIERIELYNESRYEVYNQIRTAALITYFKTFPQDKKHIKGLLRLSPSALTTSNNTITTIREVVTADNPEIASRCSYFLNNYFTDAGLEAKDSYYEIFPQTASANQLINTCQYYFSAPDFTFNEIIFENEQLILKDSNVLDILNSPFELGYDSNGKILFLNILKNAKPADYVGILTSYLQIKDTIKKTDSISVTTVKNLNGIYLSLLQLNRNLNNISPTKDMELIELLKDTNKNVTSNVSALMTKVLASQTIINDQELYLNYMDSGITTQINIIKTALGSLEIWLNEIAKNQNIPNILIKLINALPQGQQLQLFYLSNQQEAVEDLSFLLTINTAKIISNYLGKSWIKEILLATKYYPTLPEYLQIIFRQNSDSAASQTAAEILNGQPAEYALRLALINKNNWLKWLDKTLKDMPVITRSKIYLDPELKERFIDQVSQEFLNIGMEESLQTQNLEFITYYNTWLTTKITQEISNVTIKNLSQNSFEEKSISLKNIYENKDLTNTIPIYAVPSENSKSVDLPDKKSLFDLFYTNLTHLQNTKLPGTQENIVTYNEIPLEINLEDQDSPQKTELEKHVLINIKLADKENYPNWLPAKCEKEKNNFKYKKTDLLAIQGVINSVKELITTLWDDYEFSPTFSVQLKLKHGHIDISQFKLGWEKLHYQEDHTYRLQNKDLAYYSYKLKQAHTEIANLKESVKTNFDTYIKDAQKNYFESENKLFADWVFEIYLDLATQEMNLKIEEQSTPYLQKINELIKEQSLSYLENRSNYQNATALALKIKDSNLATEPSSKSRIKVLPEGLILNSVISNYIASNTVSYNVTIIPAPYFFIWSQELKKLPLNFIKHQNTLYPVSDILKDVSTEIRVNNKLLVQKPLIKEATVLDLEIEAHQNLAIKKISQKAEFAGLDIITYLKESEYGSKLKELLAFTSKKLQKTTLRDLTEIELAWNHFFDETVKQMNNTEN